MTTRHLDAPAGSPAPIDHPAYAHEEDAMTTTTTTTTTTRYLDVPGGRVAYDDAGSGPLVVCVPGLGDVRASYRFLAPQLVAAGYRVVTMDLRGHGDSSVGWADYRDTAIAGDALALVRVLDAGPATLIGNSYGGAAVAYAAAIDPAAVSALALLDAFVRDVPQTMLQRLGVGAVTLLGPRAWVAYYKTLYPSAPPADFAAYRAALKANLKEPGRYASVKAMMSATQGSHAAVEARLGDIKAPTLVVIGAKDPDFPDPAGEARRTAKALRGAARVEVAMVEGAGHYPHAEFPAVVGPRMVAFLSQALGEATRGA